MKENFPAVNRFLAIDPGMCPNRACIRLSQQRRLRDRMPGGPGRIRLGCFAPRHRPRAEAKSLQSIGMEKASVRTTKLDQRRDSTAQRSALIVHRSRQALNRVRSSGRYNRAFDDRNDASGCGPANKAHDVYRHSGADLFYIRSRQSGLADLYLACLLPRRPV